MNEENTRKLFISLKVLGRIEADQKLNTKVQYLGLDESTWYQWAVRKYRGDSRENSINKISKVISDTSYIIDDALKNGTSLKYKKYLNETATEFLKIMFELLKDAESGLTKLRNTYNYDTTISSQIEMEIIKLKKYIRELKENTLMSKKNI